MRIVAPLGALEVIVAVGLAGGAWAGMAEAAAAPSCAQLGGTVEAGQICHIQTANANYALDLRFPVDYPDQQSLTDYVVQNRDGFVNVAKTTGPRDAPYEMDAAIEQHRSATTQSVVLKIFQDLGGPQPSTWYKTFNYNLGQRREVTFDTLFPAGDKPLETIYPIVARELSRETGVPIETISDTAGQDRSHYQNFAITNDELIFYFAPGELLPASAGAVSARVPRSSVPALAL